MKTLSYALIALTTLLLGACSSTRTFTPVYQVQAKVHELTAICAAPKKKGSGGQTLAGAVIGGLIGNQFGSDGGKVAMTVLGTAAGAVIATPARDATPKPLNCRNNGYRASVSYLHPETRQLVSGFITLDRFTREKFIVIPVAGSPQTREH